MLADQIKQALHHAAKNTPWADHAPARAQDFPLETPKKAGHGHYATNMAMRLAKPLKRAPIQIAQELAAAVDTSGVIESVEVVNPGFINIRVSAAALRGVAVQVLDQGADYGRTGVGQGKKVQVEFVSANPTGPLSVGHGRLAAYGDSLARTLAAAGFAVQREFYVNDVGNQIVKLLLTVIKRIKQLLGEDIKLAEDDYQDEYLIGIAQRFLDNGPAAYRSIDKINEFYETILNNPATDNSEIMDFKNNFVIEWILNEQKDVLQRFNVEFDEFFREGFLYNARKQRVAAGYAIEKDHQGFDEAFEILEKNNDIYSKDNAQWLASSRYSDEKDRVIVKADGTKTYLMSDIAYIYNKLGVRKFDTAIYVWGADHHGYIDRIKSAAQALGFAPERLEVIIVQLVSIKGERMSKRRGNIIYLNELIEDVGTDATRFFFLTRPPGTHCDFDMDLARDKSENNPMYYLQYVHARICSMMEKAGEAGLAPDPAALDRLAEPVEMELLKLIADFPWEVQGAALAREPHRIINYLTAVAGKFHSFYHDHKVIQQDDESLSRARLALCGAVRTVFRNGLDMLGISAPEKM